MLVEFQQALADLTASPEFCIEVRRAPEILKSRYELSEREWNRLVGIVRHPGMACVCMLYRANRLAPLATHLPRLCRALGKDLRPIASQYWAAFPETNVHAFIESDRFARYLKAQIADGRTFGPEVAAVLAEEGAFLAAALRGSHTEDLPPLP